MKTYGLNLLGEGDVIYINLLGRPAIILNTLQAARDLFEKSGTNFSDRPYFLVMNDLYVRIMMSPHLR